MFETNFHYRRTRLRANSAVVKGVALMMLMMPTMAAQCETDVRITEVPENREILTKVRIMAVVDITKWVYWLLHCSVYGKTRKVLEQTLKVKTLLASRLSSITWFYNAEFTCNVNKITRTFFASKNLAQTNIYDNINFSS